MGKRVLIVDDSSNTRGILRFMLEGQGYQLVEAASGGEALEKARSAAPDLIVLDAMMPDKSGFDVCRELKGDAKTAGVPVILLSAIAQVDSSRDWATESPAEKFIAKPFRMADLLAAIEALLGVSPGGAADRARSELDSEPKGTVIRSGKHGLL